MKMLDFIHGNVDRKYRPVFLNAEHFVAVGNTGIKMSIVLLLRWLLQQELHVLPYEFFLCVPENSLTGTIGADDNSRPVSSDDRIRGRVQECIQTPFTLTQSILGLLAGAYVNA